VNPINAATLTANTEYELIISSHYRDNGLDGLDFTGVAGEYKVTVTYHDTGANNAANY
jgi:hypothetical protein